MNTQEISLNKKTLSSEKVLSEVLFFGKDFIFFAFLIILVLKSFLFIGIANNDNASSFSYIKGFYSFYSPPSIVIYSAFLVGFLSFSYLLKGRLHFWYLFFFDVILSVLMIGDLMYFRGFGSFLSPYLMSQTTNLDNLMGSVISMLRPIDALFILDIIVFLLAGKKAANYYRAGKRSVLVFLVLFTLSISAIYYEHYIMDIQNPEEDLLFCVDWVPNQTMTDLSPVGYHLYDLYNYYIENQSYELMPDEIKDIRQWLSQKEERLPNNQFKGIFKGKNLIVIQVESLENFVINQKINGQEITPNLNRLLKNSFYFPNTYEQVNDGNSSDGDLLINTSVYPVRIGSTFFRFPTNTYNSLPNLMKKKGYTTLGIHPEKGTYWNWMQALDYIGFNKTIDVSRFNQDEKIGLGLSDGSYFSQVASLLTEEKEPFYTFMVTLSSHSPFDLPAQYQRLTLEDPIKNSKLGGYFQCIRYTDQEIGHFLEKLEMSKLLDNTVVVIYGDHTGVHKYYNYEVQQLEPGEMWWLDYSKKVPFIIYSKSLKGQVFDVIGGQIDIMPTLAYLFDLDQSYKKTALGRNLLNTKKNFAVLANREFIGTAANDSEKAFLIKGMDISDLIIRSDYFKNQGFR
ncbi:MAG: LTA synthase family protein [Peptococcaceae bacterium]|nr:LTA synthase family protein [Peptococcaceae bacterium]